MDFRIWLEAIFDPSLTYQYKNQFGDDKARLGATYSLTIDDKGQIAPITSDHLNERLPFFEIIPSYRELRLHRLSPMSPQFQKFVKALRSKYTDIDNWSVGVFAQAGHMKTGNKKGDRSVAYWMQQKPVDLNNRMPLFFYHGTATNLWYSGIRDKGLLPRRMSGSVGSYGAQNVSALSQADLVYLTVHPDAAAREAAVQAATTHGGRPMIIRVRGDALFREKFVPDEDTRSTSAQDSIYRMSVIGYRGRIGASALTPYLLGRRADDKSRVWYEWKKFENVPMEDHPVTVSLRAGQVPWGHSSEYYALKDAGIIGDKTVTTDSGHRNTSTVKLKDATDAEVRDALKAGWIQNARAIVDDLGESYRGVLYQLKGKTIPEELSPENEKTIKMLKESGLLKVERSGEYRYFELNTWQSEEYAIRLAKLMGKMTFKELANAIKDIP